MKLVDVNLHLTDAEYTGYIDELIVDAKNVGVTALVTNSMDLKTCQNDVKLAEKHPNLVYPGLGIHPWNVNMLDENELQETIDFIKKQKTIVKAIGEIGLDYKYETIWKKQTMVFDKMLHLAETLELLVIMHSRGTTDNIVEMRAPPY